MKNMTRLTLAALLILALLCGSALAAGKLAVTQENFFAVEGYSLYGYVFARIENVGDKPAEYSSGLLELYDADGNTLASDTYPSVYGRYLQPGEYAYYKQYERVENGDSAEIIDDYALTVTGKGGTDSTTLRLPLESAEYIPDYPYSRYWTRNYMFATFTNTTDQTVYDFTVVLALLDAEGNILDIESVTMGSDVGVMPGASLTVRAEVSEAMRTAFEKEGLVPATVDGYAFVYIEN